MPVLTDYARNLVARAICARGPSSPPPFTRRWAPAARSPTACPASPPAMAMPARRSSSPAPGSSAMPRRCASSSPPPPAR
ncbi:hypothetical protein ACFQU7_10695 [Pseudoroseomonas wenyumeiae]